MKNIFTLAYGSMERQKKLQNFYCTVFPDTTITAENPKLIDFDLLALNAYPGFARLFKQ